MAAVELATAYVALTVETKNIAKEVQQGFDPVQKQADKTGREAGKRFTSSMGKMFAGIGGLFAGVMSGLAVKDFLGDSLAEARESQKVGALTAQVIKTTGGAAKVTAEQVGALAESISRKTGIDDEAVQTGANLLLTFKNVRNEAGAGSDVFNRATQAAVDLSKAGFGSVDSASKMLGKALNDPLKGISALSRAGVTFTAQQKKQIEAMVESGDVLGAQKIIMAEVESQVGGAAEATATAGDKARVTFDNLKESAGTKLLPIVDSLATKFTTLVDEWQNGEGTGGRIRDILNQTADAARAVVDWFVKYQDILIPLAAGILAIVAAMKIWSAITKAYIAIQTALNVVMTANPIGLVILAIVALVAIFVVAYKKSDTFRAIVQGAWEGIKKAAEAVVSWFKNTAWPWMRQAFDWIADKAKALWTAVTWQFRLGKIAVEAVVGWIKNTAWPWMRDAFQWIADKAKWLWDKGIKPAFDLIKKGTDQVVTAFRTAKDNIGKAWDALKEKAKTPIKWIIETVVNKGIIGSFNWLSDKIGGPHISDVKLPAGFASGGKIPGPWRGPRADNVLGISDAGVPVARVNPREYILPVNSTARIEREHPGALDYMRLTGRLPGFAGGGLVGFISSAIDKAKDAFAWVADKASDTYRAVTNPREWLAGRLQKIPGGKTISAYGKAVVDRGIGMVVTRVKTLWDAFKKVFDEQGGGTASAATLAAMKTNGTGYRAMTTWLKSNVPGAWVTSGYRPGAITALGNPSRHGLGRAIDIVPHNMTNFNKILGGIGLKNIAQLFYSPAGGKNVINGRYWNLDPVTRAGHYDHIHWSMARGGIVPKPLLFDRGGVLPTGTSLVHNGTGAPEPLYPGRRAENINVIIPLEDLRSLRTLEDFLERIDNARNENRKVASGTVSG